MTRPRKVSRSLTCGSGSAGTGTLEELAQRLPAFAHVPHEQPLGRHGRLDLLVVALELLDQLLGLSWPAANVPCWPQNMRSTSFR